MALQNADRALIAQAKITNYLLDLSHDEGGPKARFFYRFGFVLENWQMLEAALLLHVCTHEAKEVGRTVGATRYAVTGPLVTPDGRNPVVLTAWYIKDDEDFPRLSTARPV